MKKLLIPIVQIVSCMAVIVFLAAILTFFYGGDPRAVFLLPVAVVAGPPMALSYPFGVSFKIGYALGLPFALCLLGGGLFRLSSIKGQVCVVLGICLWTLLGLLGLGTGT